MAEFVAKAAHDLRNPLGVIRSIGEVLESTELSQERRSRYINRLLAATNHLNELIEDTLTYVSLQAGKYDITPTEIELVQFCQETMDVLQSKWELVSAPTLQSQTISCVAYLNPTMLNAIVTQLVQNAIAYSPHNLTDITVDLREDEQMVSLIVSDRGLGIPTDDQDHIFEPFFRGENGLEFWGSGLGLAIVEECVARQSGTIAFTSKVGQGSCFTVQLPRDLRKTMMV